MDTKFIIVVFLAACLIFSGMASAEKGGNAGDSRGGGSDDVGLDDKGTDILVGKGLGDVNRTQGQGQDRNKTQSQDQDRNQTQDKLRVLDQVRNQTAEHKLLLDAKLANVSNADKLKVFQNQNQVREAVMALLALRQAGNFSGGIGQNISAIAREFDNSVNKTIAAEEAIVGRDGLTRLLFGGDENAAETLQAELNQNRVRLQQLEQLRLQLDTEYQPFVDEQIRLMQEEQTRLMELAQKEQQDKGLLGWLFK
jgi:hypothetical protein